MSFKPPVEQPQPSPLFKTENTYNTGIIEHWHVMGYDNVRVLVDKALFALLIAAFYNISFTKEQIVFKN